MVERDIHDKYKITDIGEAIYHTAIEPYNYVCDSYLIIDGLW